MKLQNVVCGSLLVLLALMVVAQPVTAATHLGRNVIGLSSEADNTGVFELANQPAGSLQLHLMVYGYCHTLGISAWDCAVVMPEGAILESTELMGQGVNTRVQPGYFGVTTGEPLLPENGMVHLATLNLTITDQVAKDFYLVPAPIWGNVGGMEYSRATDESLRFNFNWPQSCDQCPVFRLTNGIQAAGDRTLGGIKTLFR